MAGLSSELFDRCREVLLECSEFRTDESLRAVFATEELLPYQNGLPEANNKENRVNQIMDYLIDKYSVEGKPIFLIFLKELLKPKNENDSLHPKLQNCIFCVNNELSKVDKVKISVDIPFIIAAMTKKEASEMLSGTAFDEGNVEKDASEKFERLRNELEANGITELAKGYGLKREEWKPLLEYVFSWDEIPGKGNAKLIKFLKNGFGIDGIKTDNIEKINLNNTIKILREENLILLKLNDQRTKAVLQINDNTKYELLVKKENNELNIYSFDSQKTIEGIIYNACNIVNKSRIELKESIIVPKFVSDYLFSEDEDKRRSIGADLIKSGCVMIVDAISIFNPKLKTCLAHSGLIPLYNIAVLVVYPLNSMSFRANRLIEEVIDNQIGAVHFRYCDEFDKLCEIKIGNLHTLAHRLMSILPEEAKIVSGERINSVNQMALTSRSDIPPKGGIGILIGSNRA